MQQDRQKMAQKQLVSHQSDARNRTHRQKSNRRPGIATTQGVVQQPVRGWVGVAGTALIVCGCAKSANEIAPAYVSPLAYQNYSCSQIGDEVQRISVRASELSGVQARS
jgi:hypothetical protein